jgi:hypothetical protein
MKYILVIPGILLVFLTVCFAQDYSAFPEDPPRPWGGAGFAYPDVGLSVQMYPRSLPIIFRPQLDFGIFQSHGYPLSGGKVTLVYLSPFSTLGIGRAYVGGIFGYNVNRRNDRLEFNGNRVLEEEKVIIWGGVLGEMIQLVDNLFLTGEIRFLQQDIESSVVDPANIFERQTRDRFATTWMIGIQYYFW